MNTSQPGNMLGDQGFDHSQCVHIGQPGNTLAHTHEGQTGYWLFPGEAQDPTRTAGARTAPTVAGSGASANDTEGRDDMERHLVNLLDYVTKTSGGLDKTALATVDQLAWSLNQMGTSQETLDALHNAAYQTVRPSAPPDDGTAGALLRSAAVAMRNKYLPGVSPLYCLAVARVLEEVAGQLDANQESGNPVTMEAVNVANAYLRDQRLV